MIDSSYLTYSWRDKRVRTFHKDISPKVNLAGQEFEYVYFKAAVSSILTITPQVLPRKFAGRLIDFIWD